MLYASYGHHNVCNTIVYFPRKLQTEEIKYTTENTQFIGTASRSWSSVSSQPYKTAGYHRKRWLRFGYHIGPRLWVILETYLYLFRIAVYLHGVFLQRFDLHRATRTIRFIRVLYIIVLSRFQTTNIFICYALSNNIRNMLALDTKKVIVLV